MIGVTGGSLPSFDIFRRVLIFVTLIFFGQKLPEVIPVKVFFMLLKIHAVRFSRHFVDLVNIIF